MNIKISQSLKNQSFVCTFDLVSVMLLLGLKVILPFDQTSQNKCNLSTALKELARSLLKGSVRKLPRSSSNANLLNFNIASFIHNVHFFAPIGCRLEALLRRPLEIKNRRGAPDLNPRGNGSGNVMLGCCRMVTECV